MNNLLIVLKPNLSLEENFAPVAQANNITDKLYLAYINARLIKISEGPRYFKNTGIFLQCLFQGDFRMALLLLQYNHLSGVYRSESTAI